MKALDTLRINVRHFKTDKAQRNFCHRSIYSMEPEKIIEIYELLHSFNVEIVIDGGWAVDALLCEQTRKHEDLDIAVNHNDVPQLRAILFQQGFTDFPGKDTKDYNFVLADKNGNKIDVHSFLFDESGRNIYGIPYQKVHFSGVGKINGHKVKCIASDWLVKFHTGYEVDENDYHDIQLLCKKFDIELPKDYNKFVEEK